MNLGVLHRDTVEAMEQSLGLLEPRYRLSGIEVVQCQSQSDWRMASGQQSERNLESLARSSSPHPSQAGQMTTIPIAANEPHND